MQDYCVFDLETDEVGRCNKKVCPLDPELKIVLAAFKRPNEELISCQYPTAKRMSVEIGKSQLLVGHNIKYDISCIYANDSFRDWVQSGGQIYDTALAEYLITGQHSKYQSLNKCAEKYGGTQKDDRIKTMYEAGMKSSEIIECIPEIFIEYNNDDVLNTELVYLSQQRYIKKHGMEQIIAVYMDHLLAVTDMEYNGLPGNYEYLQKLHKRHGQYTEYQYKGVCALMQEHLPKGFEANPDSKDQLSAIIFGGELETKYQEPILDKDGNQAVFGPTALKAGQPRMKWINEKHQVVGLYPNAEKIATTKKGVYKVDTKVLGNLPKSKLVSALSQYRKNQKINSTYLDGYLRYLAPWDNRIHTSFNTVSTQTGRLSSNQPNLQNQHPKLLKYYVADEGKVLAELDFSQLEVVIQGHVTNDAKLCEDIMDGVDFHCKRLAYALDTTYEDVKAKFDAGDEEIAYKRKKIAKPISFAKAYGAQAQTIHDNSGVDINVIEKVLQREDEEYCGIVDYYKQMQEDLRKYRVPLEYPIQIRDRTQGYERMITKPFEQAAYYMLHMPWGKQYRFEEYASLTKRGDVFRYIKPTMLKNYPIQGTAADYVSMQIGRLYRWLLKHQDKAKLLVEVHDSILLEIKEEHLAFILKYAKIILEDTKAWERRFNMPWSLPLKVDIKTGKSWKDCK